MTQGGPAIPVQASNQPPDGGPALRVAVVSDGRAVEAGPARAVVEVFDNRPTQANPPMPIVISRGNGYTAVGPPIPVRVSSGYLGSAYGAKVLSTGPIAFWPLDETSGTVVTDRSGNGRDGTYVNVTLGQPGVGDGRYAASFDGTSSRCTVFSASLAGAFNKDEGTIALWHIVSGAGVWTDASDRRAVYLAADSNNRVFLQKNAGVNQFSAQYIAGGTTKTVTNISFSPVVWFHAAVTWSKSADQMKLYINGAQVGTTQTGLGTWVGAISSGNCLVGASSGPGLFTSGLLSNVAIWNSALSAAQIATLAAL